MKKCTTYLVLLWVIGLSGQNTPTPRFSLLADTLQAEIGVPITVTLRARLQPAVNYQWPLVPDEGAYTVLKAGALDSTRVEEQRIIMQKWQVTAYDSGFYKLQFPLLVEGDTLQSNSLSLRYNFPPLKDDNDFYEIKGPLSLPPNWWRIILIAAAGALLIALIWWLVGYLRKRKKQAPLPKIQDPRAPWEKAYERLEEIKSADYVAQGEIKRYYSELVDVLRLYVEEQMAIKAMESTAAELAEKLEQVNLEPDFRQELNAMLERSALVKFAKIKPAPAENDAAYRQVRQFVDYTKTPAKEDTDDDALRV